MTQTALVISAFVSGTLAIGYWTAGLFFRRFWRKSGDPLMLHFNWALWILAIERVVGVAVGRYDEIRPYTYVLRLLAFGLLLVAIVRKNRESARADALSLHS